jgi:hypothetical protein
MPTGYTAEIAKGISFQYYVLTCARGFGALAHMRDDPFDAPLRLPEIGTYHSDALIELENELSILMLMTNVEARHKAEEDYQESLSSNVKYIKDKKDLLEKYEDMLAKTLAWQPPTPDHVQFKTFMIDQIKESIRFDCDTSYYEKHMPTKLSGQEWLDNKIVKINKDIKYHTDEHEMEKNMVESKTKWINALYGSIF